MTRVPCEGADCDATVTKDTAPSQGWTVVLTYPLVEDEGPITSRNLCRVCTRRLGRFFK